MKKRGYPLLAMILTMFLFFSVASPVFSSSLQTATVSTAALNVRSGPGISYTRLSTVTANTVLPVLSQSSGWVQVALPTGSSGWVSSGFVTLKDEVPNEWARVTTKVLNVRTGPATTHGVMTTVSEGNTFPVRQKTNGWLLIRLSDGRNGWISGTYAATSTQVPAAIQPPVNSVVKKVSVNASALNLRSGPGIGYTIMTTLSRETVLDVVSENGDWLQVKTADGQIGWVAGWLVVAIPASSEPAPGGSGETETTLAGKTIVVDPGHGGANPGAIGVTGLYEKVVVFDVAQQVAAKLRAAGATVVMTRTTDVDVFLATRVSTAQAVRADIFVSIHANAHPDPNIGGIETYYYQGKLTSQSSYYLASQIQSRLVAANGLRDIGVKHGNFHVIREATMPAVLVELAFLSNVREEALMKTAAFRQNSANAIYSGIVRYFQ